MTVATTCNKRASQGGHQASNKPYNLFHRTPTSS
jgi:hypothetical protein